MKRNILSLFFLLSVVRLLTAQTSLTLSQAVEKGVRNNFDVRISQINLAIADNQVKAGKKERLPTVSVFAQQGNNIINDRSPTTFINDFYRERNLALGMNGEWLVFDGFQGKLNRELYKTTKEERALAEKLAVENTIYTILLAYYDALIKKEALVVAQKARDLSQERLKDVQLKENLGRASRYDALRFENALLLDATNVLQKEREVETAIIQLNMAMGNKTKVDYRLVSKLDYKVQKYDSSALYRTLQQQNKELLSQHLLVEMAKTNTKVVDNTSLPTLSITSGISQRFNGITFPEIPRIKGNNFQFYFQFAANYNLFDGGRRKRTTEKSKLLEQIELVKVDQLQTNLRQELNTTIHNYQKQVEVLEAIEKLVKNLELNIQLEQDRYTNGFSSALDFRTVQLEYVNSQFSRLEIIYQLIMNELNILKLTGTLDNWN